jgi:hypothetical protein
MHTFPSLAEYMPPGVLIVFPFNPYCSLPTAAQIDRRQKKDLLREDLEF